MRRLIAIALAVLASSPLVAAAAEVCGNAADDDSDVQVDEGCPEECGNGLDDDNNNHADEGCYPAGTTGLCESPLGCARNDAIAPRSGQLVYSEPPDLEPRVPYGPGLTLRRTYISRFGSNSGFDDSLSPGWRHNFMSSVALVPAATPDRAVVRLPSAEDAAFTFSTNAGGYDYFVPQPGRHVDYLRKNTSTSIWQLRTLEGWIYEYNSSGLLTSITDGVGNTQTLAYSTGYLSTVTDASGEHVLQFTYSANKLDKVDLYVDGSLEATVDYTITTNQLLTVKYGATTMRTYGYIFTRLDEVDDGDSKNLLSVEYDYGGVGSVAQIVSPEGTLGFDYDADDNCDSDPGASVKIAFNYAGSACDDDGDCGVDEVCGGYSSILFNDEGLCFKAQRCLDLSTPSDDVVDAVRSITACATCTDNKAYAWDPDPTKLEMTNKVSATNLETSFTYDGNGQVTSMVENDDDGDASDIPAGGRGTYYYRSNGTFPSLVTEVRRKSEIQSGTCNVGTTTACQRTITAYTAGGQVDTVQQKGFTYDSSGAVVAYDFTTDYDYDGQGRLTKITGPRSDTSYDNVEFTYWSSADKLKDGNLKEVKRQIGSSTYLITTYDTYDAWGNATAITDPNSNLTCRTYETDRNLLSEERVAMNNQSTCSSHGSDLVTSYEYDTRGRITKMTKPLGNCVHYAYDGSGRLSTLKERDDCNPASSGNTQEFTYSVDGQRVKTEYKNAAGTVTFSNEVTYDVDRRLHEVKNPEDTSKKKTFAYHEDGRLASIVGEDSVGKTEWVYDALRRVDLEKRYRDVSNSDDWDLAPGIQLDLPTEVEDEDTKAIAWVWDDLGRKVKQVSPDAGTHLFVFDESGNLKTFVEADGSGDEKTHTYTYDPQNRLTAENTGDTDCFTLGGAEIQYTYDAPGSCPTAGLCDNTSTRLAQVKTQVYCDNALGDDAFDQTTYFGYDDAGRVVKESIRDDGGRVANQTHSWDKNDNLTGYEPPSGFDEKWTYGSVGSNSDANSVVKVQRDDGSVTDVIVEGSWLPFGPLAEYRQSNKQNSNFLRAKLTWDKAYRPTQLLWEEDTSGTDLFKIAYTKDAQGRITIRDFTGGHSDLADAYYTYDWLNRVTCDSKSSGACPTTTGDSNLKSSMTSSPPFTASSDRKTMVHKTVTYAPTAAATFTPVLISGKDQIDYIEKSTNQTVDVDMAWDGRGNRTYDDDQEFSGDRRDYTYDARNNLITVTGKIKISSAVVHDYVLTNAYDNKNRRTFKSFKDTTSNVEEQYFFYYDAMDRLIEVVDTPDISTSGTYTLFQISWADQRPIAYWQVNYTQGGSPGPSTSKRYVHADELGRPLELYNWSSGSSSSRTWAINPDLYGWDEGLTGGSTIYQPLSFPGQYVDSETLSYHLGGASTYVKNRPPLANNWYRFYDSYTGTYLQSDDELARTVSAYGYAAHDPVGMYDIDGRRFKKFISDTCGWVASYGIDSVSPECLAAQCEYEALKNICTHAGGTIEKGTSTTCDDEDYEAFIDARNRAAHYCGAHTIGGDLDQFFDHVPPGIRRVRFDQDTHNSQSPGAVGSTGEARNSEVCTSPNLSAR